MADRFKKESTPPPLLLMPPGGGLTLTPPEQPNILMPVIQNQSPLLSPEEEAEADSFVGQTVAPSVSGIQPTYFQPPTGSSHDPFLNIGSEPPPFATTPAVFAPSTVQAPGLGAANVSSPPSGPTQSTFASPPTMPPTGAGPPGGGNIYRQKGGRPQYVAPPSTFPPQVPGSSPLAPPTSQPPTAMVPPMPSIPHQSVPPYNQGIQSPSFHSVSSASSQFTSPAPQHQDNNSVTYTGGLFFQPVRYHWCYREDQDGIEIWRPFSYLDSRQLEMAFHNKLQEAPNNTVISTNGGRYDVNVGQRTRTAVYWDSAPVAVRRCSWFFKREGDNRYIPYEEDFATRLEDEYKKAMDTNGWHRRLEFPGNVVIVMHNANVIVQFPASAAPDEWGNVQGDQMRPRVVKRGVDDFATIMQGERTEVEHLVFFVPGIEDMSAGKHKSVETLVDDFRSNALGLLESHFTQAYQSKAINRVEFLPVIWTQALEDNVAELKGQVENITLPSTAKLRHFINNSLVDTLFYTSPIYCQKICDTVGNEMNRMFHIFLERNQSFSGDVSVAGHSLGAVILFDLLLNQRLPGQPAPTDELEEELSLSQNGASEVSSEAGEEKEEEEQTLEDLLSKIGLQDKANLFHNEQIDVDSLLMCSEQDLKDIGLQMGPRKKLLGFLNEEKVRKDKKTKEEAERKIIAELEIKKQNAAIANKLSASKGSTVAAQYIQGHFGVGQLKIRYSQLDFTPNALYALGSPIAVFLTLRGVQDLGEFFQLPTCPRVYNIFHPAFRIEPLIRQNASTVRAVQVPHYKGRKRLHLEFKEAVTRYGTDIKQKIVDSFKSTWAVINDFARAHKSEAKSNSMEDEVKSEMDQMMTHLAQQHSEDDGA
ncbi:SEC23-interacting protein, partial [Elysia marginata]